MKIGRVAMKNRSGNISSQFYERYLIVQNADSIVTKPRREASIVTKPRRDWWKLWATGPD